MNLIDEKKKVPCKIWILSVTWQSNKKCNSNHELQVLGSWVYAQWTKLFSSQNSFVVSSHEQQRLQLYYWFLSNCTTTSFFWWNFLYRHTSCLCKFSDFQSGTVEIFIFLQYCILSPGCWCPMFGKCLVASKCWATSFNYTTQYAKKRSHMLPT
jgi:hypothetical protein